MNNQKKTDKNILLPHDHTKIEHHEKESESILLLPHDHGSTEHLLATKKILNDENRFRIISDTFRTMSDTARLRIFWLLCHYEECVVNIAALMNMSSPAVSHHLRALKKSGLISSSRKGKEVYYRACETSLCHLLHQMTEQVMEVSCPEMDALPEHLDHAHTCHDTFCCPNQENKSGRKPSQAGGNNTGQSDQQKEQEETIRQVHDLLTVHMEKRWTVEELARKFLMNPTTLKKLFRATYGNSIAAHIREHRMERAAQLLLSTDLSLGEIAEKVGYSSQSKFTAAFKEYYHMLPKDYRKAGVISG